MARIRTIKPDFFFDEKITELDHKARLAFIGLWCYADKEGKMEDKPKVLKAKLFPYENIDFNKILTSLADVNMISRYVVEGKNFLTINNFQKHQRPHHTEKKSEIPDFNGIITVKGTLPDGEERVGREGKGRERKGKEVKGETKAPEDLTPTDSLLKFFAKETYWKENQQDLIDACLDHFRSKGEKKIDWEATIRNWCRTDKKYNPKNYESNAKFTCDDLDGEFDTIEEMKEKLSELADKRTCANDLKSN